MDSPMSSNISRRCSVDSNMDLDLDEYFANYVPLSNLPTPPSKFEPAEEPEGDEEHHHHHHHHHDHAARLELDLTGPATHLARVIPSNASVRRPCALAIQGYLYRSGLPLETIALTACILDALSFRFALHWRQACTKLPSQAFHRQRATTISQPQQQLEQQQLLHKRSSSAYGNSLLPPQETIVLSALSIAQSVHDDRQWRAQHWTHDIGGGACTPAQFNATIMCILQDLDYNVNCFTTNMVQQAQLAMERCVPWAAVDEAKGDDEDDEIEEEEGWTMMEKGRPKPRPLQVKGLAIEQHGLLTPEPEA